jgi:hypothetical protein
MVSKWSVVLAIAICYITVTSPALSEIYTKDQLGYTPKGTTCADNQWLQRYSAFREAYKARCQLEYYDDLLELYRQDQETHWPLAETLNDMRGDVINNALCAYLWVGPTEFPLGTSELLDGLLANKDQPLWYQYPPTLQDLVDVGIIDHLPASPYPGEAYIDTFPDGPIQPGTVYYKPLPAIGERGVLFDEPGKLENMALFIFDRIELGYDPEFITNYFRGDGELLESALGQKIPEGITYVEGIYRNYKPPKEKPALVEPQSPAE